MTTSDTESFSAISQIHPSEVAALREDGAILLDVRTPEEFASGHAPGVTFLPLNELEARFEELSATTPILAICRAGGRSQAAAEFLVSQGFSVSNVLGGMAAWASDGLPVVTDDGGAGQVI